jgi:hypothetical protein
MPRGRPSRQEVFARLDKAQFDLARAGGLPEPIVVGDIWSDIWKEETHQSTAIEGNSLARAQVDELLEGGKVSGRKDFREYLEVQAYGDAARWVYTHARFSTYERPELLITGQDVREIHELVVRTVWAHYPPEPMLPTEGPGAFRKSDLEDLRPGLAPAPPTDIPTRFHNWIESANDDPPDDCNLMEQMARLHAAFERIHPFRDGNGRVGRLVLNFLLVRQGFPPAVIYHRQRDEYLRGLRRMSVRSVRWPNSSLAPSHTASTASCCPPSLVRTAWSRSLRLPTRRCRGLRCFPLLNEGGSRRTTLMAGIPRATGSTSTWRVVGRDGRPLSRLPCRGWLTSLPLPGTAATASCASRSRSRMP